MTVVVTGRDLSRDALVRVARDGEGVALDEGAAARMTETRSILEAALAAGTPIYGSSTAVGVLKRVAVEGDAAVAYANRVLRTHAVGQGEPAPPDVVRGTMLRLANAFAEGSPGVRPALAERLVDALNAGEAPAVRTLGSIGQADLAQMADLGLATFADLPLEAGEGLAVLGSNAFATAAAALAIADAERLVLTMEVAGALSLEGLAARPTLLDPAIGDVRPYPGLKASLERLGRLLDGSALHDPSTPRNLQDPLTFRNLPHLQGACRDVLAHVDAQLAVELNASQGNPIVVAGAGEPGRVISVANFEILPLAVALDYLRLVLASALAAGAERTVKLLETTWTGLPTGLTPSADPSDPGLAYWGIAVQSLTAEARLLAQPVAHDVVSTAHAEGIEDRATHAPLAARRLAEQVAVGERIAGLELGAAAQAAELRGNALGAGTARGLALVRDALPFLAAGDAVPDAEPLVAAVRSGRFAAL
ncbi:MAG TPA: aromatic amino acid ammonia-lyase [Candidatus Limnocylindrales bacterium]|nr:aromatic amino acid ammonia-lyase [Candidatus Limnocylindrales bacterium]